MLVKAIDHINILTYDVDATVEFYSKALGLARGDSPGTQTGFDLAWMYDDGGCPLVHIVLKDPERDYGPEHVPGDATGAFHHVAFACDDFEGCKARLDAAGVAYRINDHSRFGLLQIVLKDPNNINIELNFGAR